MASIVYETEICRADERKREGGINEKNPLSVQCINERVVCLIYIVYVIESAAYGVLFASCLLQKPERARYERVRNFDTNNE